MNEEEKQAVKNFEDLLKKHFEETSVTSFNFLDGVEGIYILNIIKKQQKEIEDLKAVTRTYEAYKIGEGDKIVIASKEWFNNGYFTENYISKDKIKEKIEEITSYAYTSAEERDCQDYAIQIFKELLGEINK